MYMQGCTLLHNLEEGGGGAIARSVICDIVTVKNFLAKIIDNTSLNDEYNILIAD